VPVAAIAGGAAGGVALAVLLVIIWKHWGRVIKRTERHRRKEVQDILTVRENTRRNATSGYRPQSQYRPMAMLNPESRKVTFLTRSPTFQRGATKHNDNAVLALKPTEDEEEKGEIEGAPPAPSSANAAHLGSDQPWLQLQPSARLGALPAGAAPPVPLQQHQQLLVHEAMAEPVRRESEGSERPMEVEEKKEALWTESESESIMPPRLGRTASPTPSGSGSTSTTRRAPSPTPSRNTSKSTSMSTHSPKPSRSVRMRTPRRLPDPPSMPPGFVGRDHTARSPSPTPSAPGTSSPPPSIISSHGYETSAMPGSSRPPISIVPPVPPIPAAESSTSSTSWARSPLRNSVLASDQPVIMPRPKNARTSESQPVSPTSTWGHAPSLSGSYSASVEGGEPQSRFVVGSRRGRLSMGMASRNQRTVSTQSSISVYSNDSFGRAEER
jgi:hypothetical protein